MKPAAAIFVCAAWVIAAGVITAGSAAAQEPGTAEDDVEIEAMPLSQLLKRPDAAALAELERRFDTSADKVDRQKIAVVLIGRVADDEAYFELLAGYAREAVASEMPFPYAPDEQGKLAAERYSEEFSSWTAKNGVPVERAVAQAFRDFPGDVYLLALAGDPRATDILLAGVDSKNPMVAYRAAWGLAKLRFTPAVPAIVAAADRAVGEMSVLVARTLVLFDAPEAQAAAERLIGDPQLLAALRANAERELELTFGGA